jgi:hypothetical protein
MLGWACVLASLIGCGARSNLDSGTGIQSAGTGRSTYGSGGFASGGLLGTGGRSTGGAKTFDFMSGRVNSGGVPNSGGSTLLAGGARASAGTSMGSGGVLFATSGSGRTGGTSATGGVSWNSGGYVSTGRNLGTGGTVNDPGALTGNYDITLDTSDVGDCRTYEGLHHLNASIQNNAKGKTSISVFMDWTYPDENTFSIANDVLTVTRSQSWTGNVLPKLVFELGASGFTGVGTADVLYRCPAGTRLITAKATIGADMTPPRLRIFSYAPGHLLSPFDLSLFDFSEPVLPEGAWHDVVHSFADPPQSLDIHDVVTGAPIAHHWTNWPWGPPTVLSFDDRTAMNGRAIALDLLLPFTDRSGNRALPEQIAFPVIDAGTPVKYVDFDTTAETHAFGQATYLTADAPDNPCESGNCLALDDVTPTCLGEFNLDPLPPTFLTARFDAGPSSGFSVRYRILSSEPYCPDIGIEEAPACSYNDGNLRTDLVQLPVPYGIYDYATPWLTTSGNWCMDPTPDVGLYFYLQVTCSSPPAKFRLLVERIELVK